jgi:hypothetical protein
MTELPAGFQPLVVGALLYAAAWALWRCCLASVRLYDPEAEKRAVALLSELLSEDEQRQMAQAGYLRVPSPSVANRVYRIPARTGWVEMYDGDGLVMKLCALPSEGMPQGDVVLMHKLMIEAEEQEYLRRANVRWMRRGYAPAPAG